MVVTEGNHELRRRYKNSFKIRSQRSPDRDDVLVLASRSNDSGRSRRQRSHSYPQQNRPRTEINSQANQRTRNIHVNQIIRNLTLASELSDKRIFGVPVSNEYGSFQTPLEREVPLPLRSLINSRIMSVYPRLIRHPDVAIYQYYPSFFRPHKLTFGQACSVMFQFQYYENKELIEKTLLGFTMLIYGIPANVPEKDLSLAVSSFFEDRFGFKAEFELCVRNLPQENDPSVVGVVFKRMSFRSDIFKMKSVLEGTSYRVAPNSDLFWIARWCYINHLAKSL